MSLYDRILARPGGARALAASRLRYEVLAVLHQAFAGSGLQSQRELAEKLGVRRSAVNQVFRGDGNVRINTLAEYLHEMGYELDIHLVPAGEPRRAALEGRPARRVAIAPNWTTGSSSPQLKEAIKAQVGTLAALAANAGPLNLLDEFRAGPMRTGSMDFVGPVTSLSGLMLIHSRISSTFVQADKVQTAGNAT